MNCGKMKKCFTSEDCFEEYRYNLEDKKMKKVTNEGVTDDVSTEKGLSSAAGMEEFHQAQYQKIKSNSKVS